MCVIGLPNPAIARDGSSSKMKTCFSLQPHARKNLENVWKHVSDLRGSLRNRKIFILRQFRRPATKWQKGCSAKFKICIFHKFWMSEEQDMVKGMLAYVKKLLSPQFRTSTTTNWWKGCSASCKICVSPVLDVRRPWNEEKVVSRLVPANPAQTEKGKILWRGSSLLKSSHPQQPFKSSHLQQLLKSRHPQQSLSSSYPQQPLNINLLWSRIGDQLAAVRGWWSTWWSTVYQLLAANLLWSVINIVFLWSGVGGQLLMSCWISNCCGGW